MWMEHFKVGPQKYIMDAETMGSMQFRNPRALVRTFIVQACSQDSEKGGCIAVAMDTLRPHKGCEAAKSPRKAWKNITVKNYLAGDILSRTVVNID